MARVRAAVHSDALVAGFAAALLGAGAVLGLAGAARGDLLFGAAGGIAVEAAVVALIAAGFIDGALAVAIAAPLPAVYDAGGVRIAAVAPIAAGAVFGWVLRHGADRRPAHHGALPVRALAAILAAFLLATVAGASIGDSLRETLNFAVVAAFLVVATDELSRRRRAVPVVASVVVAAGAACGVLAVLEMVGVIPGQFPRWGTPFHRAALGFGQPNGLGLFFAAVLPLAAHRVSATRGPARAVAALALAATGLGLVATFSRAAWIAVLLGPLALALAGERRLAVRLLLGGIAAVVLVDVFSGGLVRDTVQRTIGDWVIEQRAALFLTGVSMFAAHPILGVGPGGFADQIGRYGAQITQLWDYQPTPHNAYVQMAAETGIVGLVAFVVFLALVLRALVRGARDAEAAPDVRRFRLAALWSFATICIASGGTWPFAHGTGEVVALVLALGLARSPETAAP